MLFKYIYQEKYACIWQVLGRNILNSLLLAYVLVFNILLALITNFYFVLWVYRPIDNYYII